MKKRWMRHIAALLYPPKCPVCRAFIAPEEGFCGECADKLMPFTETFAIDGAEGFFAPYVYDENSSPAVLLMKKNIGSNAPYAFGLAAAKCITAVGIIGDIDFIIPVPMHKTALKKRGFDQALLIAKEVGRETGLTVRSDIVVKHRETAQQKSLAKKERLTNLSGAFTVKKPADIEGRRILLLDDVCTTGSTMTELTAVLKEHGAAKVYCVSCCKTPSKER